MTTIISAFIAVLAVAVIVTVGMAVIGSWQRQRLRRESRALDEMIFQKEEE